MRDQERAYFLISFKPCYVAPLSLIGPGEGRADFLVPTRKCCYTNMQYTCIRGSLNQRIFLKLTVSPSGPDFLWSGVWVFLPRFSRSSRIGANNCPYSEKKKSWKYVFFPSLSYILLPLHGRKENCPIDRETEKKRKLLPGKQNQGGGGKSNKIGKKK